MRVHTAGRLPALLLAGLLAACGGGGTTASPTPTAPVDTVAPTDNPTTGSEGPFVNPCTGAEPAAEPNGPPPAEGATALAVTTVEYAFNGLLAMAAGDYAVTVQNLGAQLHEASIFQFNEGAPPIEELVQLSEDQAFTHITQLAQAQVCPGETSEAVGVTFEAGVRYGAVCFIPDGFTAEITDPSTLGPPHAIGQDMFEEWTAS